MSETKKLHVGCSPLTKTIYAGNLNKAGNTWGANRTDVTMEALVAVAEHIGSGHVMTLTSVDGSPSIEIEVREIPATTPEPSS